MRDPNFLEVMGILLCSLIVLAIFGLFLNLVIPDFSEQNCMANGYSKYIAALEKGYCLHFSDGIIDGIGLVDSNSSAVTPLGINE